MTMTPETVAVACSRCGRPASFDHDEIRELCDRSELPVCNGCLLTPERYSRPPSAATARAALLRAAAAVETADEPASLTGIVVRAWADDPRRFGLPGRGDLPDSNRVNTEVVHAVRRGLLFRVRPREYRLSAAGRSYLEGVTRRATECSC